MEIYLFYLYTIYYLIKITLKLDSIRFLSLI